MMTWLGSWKLWLALALVAGAIGVVTTGLHQARTIGSLEGEVDTQRAAIKELGQQLGAQHRAHQQALAARDAALAAEKAHTHRAERRAKGLAASIQEERVADADVDACMGMRLPDGIAERLRQ